MDAYERGLESLQAVLEERATQEEKSNFYVCKAELKENLRREGLYGQDQNSYRKRFEIIEKLIILGLKYQTNFNDLCK